MTKVVILCGGKGTRLREETDLKPKPMVNIGDKPILWHIMRYFSHYNLHDFVLCLGYKGEYIKSYFSNYDCMSRDFTINLGSMNKVMHSFNLEEMNWNVTLAYTGENNMTGSRVSQIKKYINDDYFIATYGDAVADINIDELIKFHKSTGKIATLTGIRPSSKYGMLQTIGDSVTMFNEKPISQDYVNGGFFVFEKEIFNYLSDDEQCVLEKIPLERLAQENQLAIYRHDGFWQCMDTYRDYEILNKMLINNQTPWMIWRKGQNV